MIRSIDSWNECSFLPTSTVCVRLSTQRTRLFMFIAQLFLNNKHGVIDKGFSIRYIHSSAVGFSISFIIFRRQARSDQPRRKPSSTCLIGDFRSQSPFLFVVAERAADSELRKVGRSTISVDNFHHALGQFFVPIPRALKLLKFSLQVFFRTKWIEIFRIVVLAVELVSNEFK